MQSLKISTKFYAVVAFVMLVGMALFGASQWVKQHTNGELADVLAKDVHASELSDDMAAHYMHEEEQWREMLLHGDNAKKFEQNWTTVQTEHANVKKYGAEARKILEERGLTSAVSALDDFLNAHAAVLPLYVSARQTYIETLKKDGMAAAVKAADEQIGDADHKPEEAIKKAGELIRANEVERKNTILASSQNWTVLLLVLGVLAFMVTGLAAYIVARAVARSLSDIVHRFKDVSSGTGDLTQRIEIKSGDELGQLSEYFNKFMDQLEALVTSVQVSAYELSASAQELSATARQQEASVNELAATAKEIAATTSEISATSQELQETIGDVSRVTENASKSAGESRLGIESMERVMAQMVASAGTITNRLSVMSEKASNISSVVTTIMKVADQTNLLSLNAAIEAEKAGEAGLGFAVVANEVRRLADQTASASTDIERMVKEMQAAVASGVMGMDGFAGEIRNGAETARGVATRLGTVVTQVQDLAPRFDSVKDAMNAQRQGASQISEGVNMVAEASGQTSDTVQQTNEVIVTLTDSANDLREQAGRFKVSDIDGALRARSRNLASMTTGGNGRHAGNGGGGGALADLDAGRKAALRKIAQAKKTPATADAN